MACAKVIYMGPFVFRSTTYGSQVAWSGVPPATTIIILYCLENLFGGPSVAQQPYLFRKVKLYIESASEEY